MTNGRIGQNSRARLKLEEVYSAVLEQEINEESIYDGHIDRIIGPAFIIDYDFCKNWAFSIGEVDLIGVRFLTPLKYRKHGKIRVNIRVKKN